MKKIFSIEEAKEAKKVIETWPGYGVTPLRSLDILASEISVKKVFYKDEASRFGLGSFKALGGAYAVYSSLIDHIYEKTGQRITLSQLSEEKFQNIAKDFVVACATAGNHGRSVAWGAELFGCPCYIYLHSGVGKGRADAIARYGAEIVRVDGNYDASVKQAAIDAEKNNWTIISDTSYPGYMDIPRKVVNGYTVMFDEIIEQLKGTVPTHVFLQAGVGGLASAACAYFWELWQENRPDFVIVEPEKADCLFQSARAGKMVSVDGDLETHMLGLACGEPSHLAWDVLSQAGDYFMTIEDKIIFDEIRNLANNRWGSEKIIAGESAVAGLSGLLELCNVDKLKHEISIDENSVILLFGTEGATDPEIYHKIIYENYNG
ncbi:MAG: diaminopropionate ammonia-lyase [Emcibacteraceae bacterium]|nr:diaminopropionate ammonia-lyase [Emcibacteraceae bacterium]